MARGLKSIEDYSYLRHIHDLIPINTGYRAALCRGHPTAPQSSLEWKAKFAGLRRSSSPDSTEVWQSKIRVVGRLRPSRENQGSDQNGDGKVFLPLHQRLQVSCCKGLDVNGSARVHVKF